jgi:hypothetical protein
MSGLKLNGIDVPVLADSVSSQQVIIQDKARAFDGTPRSTVRARKREWQLKLGPQPQALADAFRKLINGEGHAWSFDSDLYSSKGLGPNGGHSATIVSSGKYGSKMRVPASTSITWATNLGSNWTVIAWRLESGSWRHWVATSAGHRWYMGGRDDSQDPSPWLTVSSGSMTITAASVGTIDFDEIRALPFVIDDSWGAQIYAEDSVRATSALPRLNASGDLVLSGPVSVLGEVGETPVFGFSNAGSWVTNGETPAFVLAEV